jgi:hypothetical protein
VRVKEVNEMNEVNEVNDPNAPSPSADASTRPAVAPANVAGVEEDSEAAMILWLGLIASVVLLAGSSFLWIDEYRGLSLESILIMDAEHPVWVQLPVRLMTIVLFGVALRRIRRMSSNEAASRRAVLTTTILLIINILATTRLVIDPHRNAITIRVLGLTVSEYVIPRRIDALSPCYSSYERGFRILYVDGRAFIPPWLPLPVDWDDRFDNPRFQSICIPGDERFPQGWPFTPRGQ